MTTRKNLRKLKILISAIALSLVFIFQTNAELIGSQSFGYTIDFPEGFEISDMEKDETTVIFRHKILSVEALIKIWPKKNYSDPKNAIEETMKKLNASHELSEVIWRNKKCAVVSFSSDKISEKPSAGWGISVPLPESKGYLILLTYAPKETARDCEQFMISLLDSIFIDSGSLKEPGIITTAFFPRKSPENLNIEIGGQTIQTQIDKIDREASQFVLEREFEVFKLYALQNSEYAIPAWQRFYRTVARDYLGRLKKMSFDIKSALQEQAEKKDPQNQDAAIAQILLAWTQNFKYGRISQTADNVDFTNLIDTVCGKESDCDSRSMLLAVLTKNMGMDSCFFISSEYSHAMFAVNFPEKQGQTIKIDEKEYLVGETTHKDITLGMIPADMQDRTKWIPVEFLY